MPTKAKWWEYLAAPFDSHINIADDGTFVSPDGVPLSDELLEYSSSPLGIAHYWGDPAQYAKKMGATWESEVAALDNLLSGSKVWRTLSSTEKADIISQYGTAYSRDRIIDDIAALDEIGSFNLKNPVMSDYVDSSEDLYASIDNELAPIYDSAVQRLDDEMSVMRQDYLDQLKSSADMYNRQASGLLSNQYLANAQTYEALQSDMRKSRQNALEAGASAGIRLAGNINTLLTAQNKQSQTAMDTSNALAEMLLQQRNAAAGVRSDYRNYMSGANQRRTDLDVQRQTHRDNLYSDRHSAQLNDYDRAVADYTAKETNYANQYSTIPVGNKFKNVAQARNRTYDYN